MFFIGIDVSKAKLDCSLLLDDASNKRRAKAIANSITGIADLLINLNTCTIASGDYSTPIS